MELSKDDVTVIQSETARLNEYLDTVPADAMSRPSAVDGWEVGFVVAHLCLGCSQFTGYLTRAVRGDTSAPQGMWQPGAATAATGGASALDQKCAALREGLGRDQLIPTFHALSGHLASLLAGLGPSDLELPCYHHVFGVRPIREILTWWITELAMHSLDIRSVLETDAHLSTDCLHSFMEFMPKVVRWSFRPDSQLPAAHRSGPPWGCLLSFMELMPEVVRRSFRPDSQLPAETLCFRVEITGPVPSRSDIVVGHEKAEMKPAGHGPADVTYRCDAETFALLMYGRGRLSFDTVGDRLVIEGNRELVPRFAKWFPGT